jgi:hypothetical protein
MVSQVFRSSGVRLVPLHGVAQRKVPPRAGVRGTTPGLGCVSAHRRGFGRKNLCRLLLVGRWFPALAHQIYLKIIAGPQRVAARPVDVQNILRRHLALLAVVIASASIF